MASCWSYLKGSGWVKIIFPADKCCSTEPIASENVVNINPSNSTFVKAECQS